jgi:Flp pilus assembly protein TadG
VRSCRRETGAVAVEMALVLPLLLFILCGIIDLGRAFNTQIQLSQAAREGARLVAMQSPSDVVARVQQAAPGLTNPAPTVRVDFLDAANNPVVGATDCASANVVNARVTVTVAFSWITGISGLSRLFGPGTFPNPTQENAIGVMQCSRLN